MRTGVTISAVAHVVLLGSTMLWFSGATPLKITEEDSVPIDIISDTQFSKLTAGMKTAPKADSPKLMADKVGDPKQAQDQAAKVVDKKPEIRTASQEATPPAPEPKPKTPEKTAEQTKPEPKPDEIAEAIKKAEKKPTPPKPQGGTEEADAQSREPNRKQAGAARQA